MKLHHSLLPAAILGALALASTGVAAATGADAAVTRARGLIDAGAAPAILRAADDRFVAKDTAVDANGSEHVRFQRTYRGLPVLGGDFVMHSRNGKLQRVTSSLDTTARPGITPKVARAAAIVEAGARFGSGFIGAPQARLVVYALGGHAPTLAWEVAFEGIRNQTPTEMHYFVDANTGAVIRAWDAVQTAVPGPDQTGGCAGGVAAAGTGASKGSGTVAIATTRCGDRYRLNDMGRGGGYTTNMLNRTSGTGTVFIDTDNAWGNGTLADMSTAAVDAHYGIAKTWDYYRTQLGRLGIANDGKGAVSRVHYGRNYVNAFWRDSCFCMTFGDGDNGVNYNPLTVLDVSAHEMSHGVTSRTAGLIYDGESGGLNEATSDIFGTMVEYYANNPVDRPDYLVGEGVYANNPNNRIALRYMFKPSLDGASADCWDAEVGDLDVHFSSGIANHFFYLLAQGTVVPNGFGPGTEANLTPESLVCSGPTTLTALGRSKAQRIWYRALTVYMLPDTDYAGAREATLLAANDLFGGASTEYAAVAAAWDAVDVH